MKRQTMLILMAVMFMVMAASTVQAYTNNVECVMTVTVTAQRSVTVGGSPLAFGSVAVGANAVTSTGATITNDGETTQTYTLALTGVPSGWTLKETAGATGNDEMKLLALFTSSNPPATGDFNDTAAEDVVCDAAGLPASATVYAKATEGTSVNGLSCTYGAVRKLWFKFFAPAKTAVNSAQNITVTVTAGA